jgi:outer membrane protein OmpA-like peptidoglycan-associated protein/opacity protein-like surface antigen
MSYRFLKAAAWMLALGVPTLARAQQAAPRGEGTWEYTVSGGVSMLDGALRGYLNSGAPEYRFATNAPGLFVPTLVGRVGYNFSRHIGASVALAAAGGSGIRYLTLSGAGTYTWNLNAKTSPFVLVGTELTRIDGTNSRTTHATWGLAAGVGVRRMISEKLALRLEGRLRLEGYQELAAGDAWTSVFTLGLSYFVGGRRHIVPMAEAPSCPRCTLARVDTVRVFRRDTLRTLRTDTVRVVRVDTVTIAEEQLVLRTQFRTDSTVLLRRELPALDTIAKALAGMPEAYWEVQGHTDNVGTPEHNMVLSRGRAESVLEYLVNRGVARDHLVAHGYGESRPVVSNATVEGRAQNRRVQIRRRQMEPPPGRPVP